MKVCEMAISEVPYTNKIKQGSVHIVVRDNSTDTRKKKSFLFTFYVPSPNGR